MIGFESADVKFLNKNGMLCIQFCLAERYSRAWFAGNNAVRNANRNKKNSIERKTDERYVWNKRNWNSIKRENSSREWNVIWKFSFNSNSRKREKDLFVREIHWIWCICMYVWKYEIQIQREIILKTSGAPRNKCNFHSVSSCLYLSLLACISTVHFAYPLSLSLSLSSSLSTSCHMPCGLDTHRQNYNKTKHTVVAI
jgi:hypothetical protein